MESWRMSTYAHKGFAMLFTVLLVSLILTIAMGISNLTLRQTILSNLAKDSGIAFYQADAAVECGLYQEWLGNFPQGATTTGVPSGFTCGGVQMVMTSNSRDDYFEYTEQSPDPRLPCYTILFDKTHAYDAPTPYSRVLGSGKNLCGQNPRQVERALEVKYR